MSDYEEYVRKMADKHGITIEEAERLQIVKNVKEYYEEDQMDIKRAGWSQEE